jgi:SAM-dependent methyltransferase
LTPFERLQRAHSARPESERFHWQTRNGAIRALEEALLAPVFAGLDRDARLLEIGCGEGSNLLTLRRLGFRGHYTGVDFSQGKIAFARGVSDPASTFLVADASRLPFADRSFEQVLCRDVLHHVADPESALREASRVAASRLCVIEPNPRSPLIAGFAIIDSAERGMLRSTRQAMARLFLRAAPGFSVDSRWAEPQNLTRLLCHHRFGLPSLGNSAGLQRLLRAFDQLAQLAPRQLWAYQVFFLTR